MKIYDCACDCEKGRGYLGLEAAEGGWWLKVVATTGDLNRILRILSYTIKWDTTAQCPEIPPTRRLCEMPAVGGK